MQLKVCFLSIIILALASHAYAQDKIFRRDGEIIDAKIKSVGTKTITYTRFDNQSGPEYTIAKAEVERIKYQNGTEDQFEPERLSRHYRYSRRETHMPDNTPAQEETNVKKKIYSYPNLLALAPVQFTENGLGFSVSYERVLDASGIVAFTIPIVATYNLNNGTYYNNNTGTYENGHQDGMYYIMPGVKLYPTGCYGRVRYGIGPSIVLATGEKSSPNYGYYGSTTYSTDTHNLLGMMLNNSLNINPGPHVYIGFEFGLGFTYLNRVGGLNQNSNVIVQGNFKVGYRF